MTDVKLGNRVFTLAVVAMTILWTVAAGLAPLATSAQVSLSQGDLIKGESFSTVYYYGSDGMRYTFPNEKTYFAWYSNFDSVTTISDSQLAGITLGGNAVYRSGTNWVKIQSDPSVYAVSPDGTLHWIESEAVATALYGGNGWASFVHDVPDTFFADYTTGTSLMSADALYNGALVTDGTSTYVIQDGAKRMLSGTAMSANRYNSAHVLSTTVDLSGISDGAALSGYSAELSDVAQLLEGDTEVSAAGGLTISVASDTPAGATLPGGANGVAMAKWRVSASGGDSTLDSLEVSLGGIGAVANISNLYLYEGTARLTESRSVNSATRNATFSNLGFVVANGTSRYVTAVAEISTTQVAADSANFSLTSASAVGASGDVSGTFPATGNTFTFGGVDVGTVTIAKSGTIVNSAIGQQDAQIGQFQVTANSEDASIERLRLKIDNATDHGDFRLLQGTTLLSNGVWSTGDFVDFTLTTPYAITDGSSKIFKVTADVAGTIGDDVKVSIDKDTDVTIVGGNYGFNMGVTRTAYDGDSCTTAAGDCSWSEMEGGDVTITANGPATGDISTNSQDNVFLAFTLTTTEDITVKDFDLIIAADDDGSLTLVYESETGSSDDDTDGLVRGDDLEANVKDISIRYADTGARLMGPVEITASDATAANDAYQLLTFSDDFFMAAGTSLDLEITVDIDNNAPANELFGVAINIGSVAFEDANGDSIATTSIVPSGDINGNAFTTQTPSLAFALGSSPTTFTTVQGSADQKVVGFTATAGTASDVTVTSITLTAYGDDTSVTAANYTAGGEAGAMVADHFSSCSLYNGAGTLLSGPKGSSTSGTLFVFDSMSWDITAGAVEKLDVICNLANPSDAGPSYFAFNIGGGANTIASHVVSQDANGDSITETADEPNGNIDGAAPTVGMTVNASGSLAVTLDSGTPNAALLMSGSSDNLVSKYRFTATNEDQLVTTMSFTEYAAEADTGTANSAAYANNISAVKLSYPDVTGATQTATAYMAGNEVIFTGLTMYVPSNSPKTVSVYVNIPGIDRDSGGSSTSGEKIRMAFYDDDNSGTDGFRSVGQGSGSVLTEASGGIEDIITSKTFVVRETMPTVSLHASSPSGAKIPGLSEVLRFSISAASNEDVIVDELVFKMTSTDLLAAGASGWNEADTTVVADFSLYNYSNLSTELEDTGATDWLLMTTGGVDGTTAVDIGFVRLENMADDIVIAAGTTETYSLYFDSTGASAADDDSMRFDIPADPILPIGAWNDSSTFDFDGANTDRTDTSLVIDTGSSRPAHGDIVCISTGTCAAADETILVTNVGVSAGGLDVNLYAQRGYMGDTTVAIVDNDEADYLASSFVWYDDGSDTDDRAAYEDEVWGSYLVPGLPLIGGTIVF